MSAPEHIVQVAVMQHLRHRARPGVVYFAIPNGGHRSKATAAYLKAEGVRAGVADIGLVLPPDGKAAFLELKREKGGQVRPTQKAFGADVSLAGALYAVACGVDEAVAQLTEWGVLR